MRIVLAATAALLIGASVGHWMARRTEAEPLAAPQAGGEARPLDPRAAEAKQLLSQGRGLEAARLVSPCLTMERSGTDHALEDCLFVGEQVATGIESRMNGPKPGNWDERTREVKALGVELVYGKWGVEYQHDYFRRLALLFPESRYRDLYDFVFRHAIEPTPGGGTWRGEEAALRNYLSAHPKGRYATRAKLNLAYIYDNVWELMRPETAHPSYRYEVTDEPGGDPVSSENYRQQALETYAEVIAAGESTRLGISESEFREAVRRRAGLERGEPGHTLWIIDD